MTQDIPATQTGEQDRSGLFDVANPMIPSHLAWYQVAKGKPKDVLRLVHDAPVPRLAPDEVLVKGKFASPEVQTFG